MQDRHAPATDRGGAPPEERRGEVRRRQLKDAQIVYNHGNSLLDCTIENLSADGARLRIDMPMNLPDTFSLHFRDGRKHQAEVVWRRGDRLGVRFADPGGSGPTRHDGRQALIERIARIERELAALRSDLTGLFRD